MLVFEERAKLEQSRETTTNSTYTCCQVRESNVGHIGERQALSPLSPSLLPLTIQLNLQL